MGLQNAKTCTACPGESSSGALTLAAMRELKIDGIGLGLSGLRSIVESVGGRIGCEPTDGDRASFHFMLPAAGPRPV